MTILRELGLDASGDLDITGGTLHVIDGRPAVAQRIQTRLRTIKGEWIFDKLIGTPWFQEILGGRARSRLGTIEQIFRRRIGETSGVSRVVDLSLGFDAGTRELKVSGSAVADDASEIPISLEFG